VQYQGEPAAAHRKFFSAGSFCGTFAAKSTEGVAQQYRKKSN